jgi:hypothetical protein
VPYRRCFSTLLWNVIKMVQEDEERLKCNEAHQLQVHCDCGNLRYMTQMLSRKHKRCYVLVKRSIMYVNTRKIRYILVRIMEYLLKARTGEPEKEPFLGNDCVTRSNGVTVSNGVFCAVRAEAI